VSKIGGYADMGGLWFRKSAVHFATYRFQKITLFPYIGVLHQV